MKVSYIYWLSSIWCQHMNLWHTNTLVFPCFLFLSGVQLFGMFAVGGVTASNQHWHIHHCFANVVCNVRQLSGSGLHTPASKHCRNSVLPPHWLWRCKHGWGIVVNIWILCFGLVPCIRIFYFALCTFFCVLNTVCRREDVLLWCYWNDHHTVFYANIGIVVNETVSCPQKKGNRLQIRGLCALIVIDLKTCCVEIWVF